MTCSHLCIPKNETVISKTELLCSVSQFLHSYICERFIYFQDWSAYSAARKYVDRSWEYINHSQTHECHECGNWDEAAQFPEKEYINGIFVAVWGWWFISRSGTLIIISNFFNAFWTVFLTWADEWSCQRTRATAAPSLCSPWIQPARYIVYPA
jgi:hypothetical protein